VFDKIAEVDIDSIMIATERMINNFADLAEETPMSEMAASLEHTLGELDRTMASFRDIAHDVAENLDLVSESAAERSDQLESVFMEAEQTLIAVQGALDPESPLTIQLGQTLYELGNAARALRVLTESLEQNPSALLRGRPIPEGNR
jgi:paraquat-inducible protein B